MSEYAELDAKGNVLQIIVIDEKELAKGRWGNPKHFVRREDLPKPPEVEPAKPMPDGNASL